MEAIEMEEKLRTFLQYYLGQGEQKKDVVQEDDIEMLEDLIMAAINDGYKKADEVYNEKMGPFANSGLI